MVEWGNYAEAYKAIHDAIRSSLTNAPEGKSITKIGFWEDVNGNGVIDAGDLEVINIEITNHIPYQIDPCNTNKAEIDMEYKQAAEECHTYTIHVSVVAIQWNKN